MKSFRLFLGSVFLLLYLIFFPKAALSSACQGVNLWFHTVLPSLLPFLILSSMIIQTGFFSRFPAWSDRLFFWLFGLSSRGFYAFFLGMLCGFPMGSKITAQLYDSGQIDRAEADYLLTFCSHASPAFLSSYVILHGLHQQLSAFTVFSILYSANLLTAFLSRIFFHRFSLPKGNTFSPSSLKKEMPKQTSPGNLLDISIMNGFETITQLGGYIILFSIISGLVMQLPKPFDTSALFLCGMLEITTGIAHLSSSALPFFQKALAILICTAFGGLSAAAQTNCMIRKSGLSLFPYFIGKCCCAALAGILFLFFFTLGFF